MNAPHVPSQSSMLHIRMDNDLKAKATEALAAMGLTAPTPCACCSTASRSTKPSRWS
jgi:hypothetical protein